MAQQTHLGVDLLPSGRMLTACGLVFKGHSSYRLGITKVTCPVCLGSDAEPVVKQSKATQRVAAAEERQPVAVNHDNLDAWLRNKTTCDGCGEPLPATGWYTVGFPKMLEVCSLECREKVSK